jgi:hypothetical protein
MRKQGERIWWAKLSALIVLAGAFVLGGCGLVYQAGARVKTSRMADQLKAGETSLQVHNKWGEPDLRKNVGENSEVWSYARRANSNDITATLLYTSTKAGDEGKFLDLTFVGGKLVSWAEAEHTMPAKQGSGFTYGFGPGGAISPISHY